MKRVRSLPPRLFTLSVLFSALVLALAPALASPVRADFSDVPSDHWAYAYVSRAEQSGAVNGVGGGRFDPDSSVTEAQFYAMLLRTLTDGEIPEAAPGEPWYSPYTTAAFFSGLSVGVNAQSPDTPLT
ncbi:MAG: S-layer homology domain-containing protein, partial [Clostridia bacterium]|nr:S-layer homology domain-containing protein [Clostridia bacterium]